MQVGNALSGFKHVLAAFLTLVAALAVMVAIAVPNVAYATSEDTTASNATGAATNAAATEEVINDEENPLAGFDPDPQCWIHWLMAAGILATVAYGSFVVYRRRTMTSQIEELEDELLGIRADSNDALAEDAKSASHGLTQASI